MRLIKIKINIWNKLKKKYETKMKELKNYQNFEISNFDKITKGITKPSYRIQNIVNSTALVGENENNEIENESEGNIKEEFNKNGIKNKEIPENKIPDNVKAENNENKEKENKENEENNENEENKENNKIEEEEFPIAQEEKPEIDNNNNLN